MNPDGNDSKIRQLRECLGEATHLDELVVGAASSSTSTAGTSRQDRPDLPSSASLHGGQGRLLGRARPGGVAPVRLNQTLGRARSMIQQASSSGLLRRLSRTERLRSTATATMSSVSKPPKKPKLEETRPFEFVLMNFGEDHDVEKVKLCGQGAICVMLKPEFSFMLETTSLEDDVECLPASSANSLSTSTVSSANILPQNTNSTLISKENMTVPSALESFEGDTTGPSDGSQSTTSNQDEFLNNATGMLDDTSTHSNTSCDKSLDGAIKACIAYCKEKEISEPVEILRQVQKYVITGRKLEPTDESEALDGTTNFILIDRHNVLVTAFDELKAMKTDPRLTLEVSFYGENAQDFGGPRKEFFNLAVGEIKAKYFDKGWREHLTEDYEMVGLILAMSMLQSGILQSSSQPSSSSTLTLKRLLLLLKPTFSEEGNNKRMFENSVYSCFVKYARNVASGQRQRLSLDNLLKFATGACKEPCLGFSIHPCIDFVQSTDGNKWPFIPTASTCTNKIYLPSGSRNAELPNEDELFEIYDFAFTDRYFGKL
eukprot:gene12620-13909_t